MLKTICTLSAALTLAAASLFLTACGGAECPPPNCPVCQVAAPPAPAPAPGPTGPTADQWVPLPIRILFPNGGSELTAENQVLLQEAVQTMNSRPDIQRVRVEGHTDSRGADGMNAQLAAQRAQAVMQYLIANGVPAHMLEAQGFGSERPITSDSQEMDRAQNRRVEFSALIRRQIQ